jgi:hypothetical protein
MILFHNANNGKTRWFRCRIFLFALLIALFPGAFPVNAQAGDGNNGNAAGNRNTAEKESAALPRSFRQISLGMGLDDLKIALDQDELFYFRGDRDVSLLPAKEESLIEVTGFAFVSRAFFQLREGRLFIMAFSLNPRMVDHYSVYTTFVEKYGEPQFLDPKQAVWESEELRVAIERPLTVKYLDKQVFDGIISESQEGESLELYLRDEFLREF